MFLDRYLTRIGVPAPAAPDLPALQAVITGHTRSIAFENLDPLTGVEPALDSDGLAAKLVDGGRGGWCFEQNGLLRNALTELGYQVTGLAARVRYRRPPEAPPQARGHMLLRVDGLPDGPHLVDVGFGGARPRVCCAWSWTRCRRRRTSRAASSATAAIPRPTPWRSGSATHGRRSTRST